VIALLLALGLAQAGALPPGEPPPEIAAEARAVRALPLADRIDRISAALVGRPYALDPAGEGILPDAEPPGRWDRFDCLTFAEEVLSLALAPDPVAAGSVRNALRWGEGPVTHATRRHHMELQWIPGAVADGWLVDRTATLGRTVRRERTLGAADWARWSGTARLGLPPEALPTGRMALDVLPLEVARAAVARIAPGSLVLVVRADRPDVPLWVTHVGLVVHGGRLRHASAQRSRLAVTEHALGAYLDQLATWRGWPVDGIVVLEPRDPLPPPALSRDAASSRPANPR
jgi:hypothetical protein